jgi:acylglycerol lipase
MSTLSPRIDYYRATDGRRLAARVWEAAGHGESSAATGQPRPRVVFLHGITSHGGWYDRSCRYLAEAGFEVHFLDRRGSGLNLDCEPGDVDRHQTWLDDVEVYLEALARIPLPCREGSGEGSQVSPPRQAPPVLCGISWGGKLAVAVARHRPHLVKALGLLCPGLYSPHEPGLVGRTLLAMPKPARLMQRRVWIPLQDPALFTDSPRRRDYIADDPLSLRKVTVRFARADRRLTRFARRSAPFLRLPVLLMLSGYDRIVDNRRTRAFLGRVPSAHKTLIEYPNAAHTLEFERDPLPYFRDLADWVGGAG